MLSVPQIQEASKRISAEKACMINLPNLPKCSGTDPCDNCVRVAPRLDKLGLWSLCARPSIRDKNVFREGLFCPSFHTEYRDVVITCIVDFTIGYFELFKELGINIMALSGETPNQDTMETIESLNEVFNCAAGMSFHHGDYKLLTSRDYTNISASKIFVTLLDEPACKIWIPSGSHDEDACKKMYDFREGIVGIAQYLSRRLEQLECVLRLKNIKGIDHHHTQELLFSTFLMMTPLRLLLDGFIISYLRKNGYDICDNPLQVNCNSENDTDIKESEKTEQSNWRDKIPFSYKLSALQGLFSKLWHTLNAYDTIFLGSTHGILHLNGAKGGSPVQWKIHRCPQCLRSGWILFCCLPSGIEQSMMFCGPSTADMIYDYGRYSNDGSEYNGL
jgi:hypothetical protein